VLRNLLIAMGVVEVGAGLALLVAPSLVAEVLLGSPLVGAPGLIVARLCGAGLLSLGIACWLARGEAGTASTTGLVIAMLFYNTAAAAVLVYSLLGLGLMGVLLWPAIVIHVALGIWCLVCLLAKPSRA
jgi:hypothetical protein